MGGGEEVAMKLSFEQPASLEQRAARKAVIDGMGRALRGLWKDEPTAPLPERLLHPPRSTGTEANSLVAQSQDALAVTTLWVREAHSDCGLSPQVCQFGRFHRTF